MAGLNMPPVTCGVVPGDPNCIPTVSNDRSKRTRSRSTVAEPPCRVARLAIDTDWEYSEPAVRRRYRCRGRLR